MQLRCILIEQPRGVGAAADLRLVDWRAAHSAVAQRAYIYAFCLQAHADIQLPVNLHSWEINLELIGASRMSRIGNVFVCAASVQFAA